MNPRVQAVAVAVDLESSLLWLTLTTTDGASVDYELSVALADELADTLLRFALLGTTAQGATHAAG